MKIRHLTILTVLLALIAGALYLADRRSSAIPGEDPRVGQVLLDPETAREARMVRLYEGGDPRVEMIRNAEGTWILPAEQELPVDFGSLSRLIRNLTESRVQRFVTRREERLERIEPKSESVALYADPSAESPLAALHFGKRSDSGGSYVQFGDDPAAYLADPSIFVNTRPDSWIDKALLPFEAEAVRRLEVPLDEGDWLVLERSGSDKPFAVQGDNPPEGEPDPDAIRSWIDTLAGLRFTEYRPRDDAEVREALSHARIHTLVTEDGRSWKITFARRPEKVLPADQTDGADDEGSESEPETIPAGPAFVLVDGEPELPGYFRELAFRISSFTFERQPEPGELIVLSEAEDTE